jgi:hypothetical protein
MKTYGLLKGWLPEPFFLGNYMKRSIIGGDLILPQVNWKGIADGTSVSQAFKNRLMWDNGYTKVV